MSSYLYPAAAYYYPDMPKNYQITQNPPEDCVGMGGYLDIIRDDGSTFRVDIDNTEDVNLVLGYLKNFIINEKIKNLISKHCEKVVEEIGKNISEEILKFGY